MEMFTQNEFKCGPASVNASTYRFKAALLKHRNSLIKCPHLVQLIRDRARDWYQDDANQILDWIARTGVLINEEPQFIQRQLA
jgi:hypothetical protein